MTISLGIDFGLSHIGLALADGLIAQPLLTLNNTNSAVSQIVRLAESHQIQAIVVGLPDGQIAASVKNFVSKLKQTTSIPISFQDETLSSQDATVALIHTTKSKRRSRQHAAAAALILQSWIDSRTD